jgi:hypothetical protein
MDVAPKILVAQFMPTDHESVEGPRTGEVLGVGEFGRQAEPSAEGALLCHCAERSDQNNLTP